MNLTLPGTEFVISCVDQGNLRVYLNLAQAYEAEFSSITDKHPDRMGLYALDTEIEGSVKGFLLGNACHAIGLAAVNVDALTGADLREFFIVPTMRRRALGSQFAKQIFGFFPGRWTVKQLKAAHHATEFWRRSLKQMGISYEEMVLLDEEWGEVVMQVFQIEMGTGDGSCISLS